MRGPPPRNSPQPQAWRAADARPRRVWVDGSECCNSGVAGAREGFACTDVSDHDVADAAFPSRAVPTRAGPPNSRYPTFVGCSPQRPRDEARGVERAPANSVVALQRTVGNRATARAIAIHQRQPTFGNLYGDAPAPGADVVRLEQVDGKWREMGRRIDRTARGRYDFVVRDGRLWAVKAKRTLRPAGHTEASQGNRVAFAGQVEFEAGTIKGWNDGSGHFRPAAEFRQAAIDAGLPPETFARHPDTLKRPRPPGEIGPQLPVEQPATRPRTAGEPAKVGPGPPRLDELERHYGAPRATPAASTPTVEVSPPRPVAVPAGAGSTADPSPFPRAPEARHASWPPSSRTRSRSRGG